MKLEVQGRPLGKDSPHSNIRSVGLHHKLAERVRMYQDGSCGEAVFKIAERPVSSWGPPEPNLGRGECRQGEARVL
jgi:hypothetical protein